MIRVSIIDDDSEIREGLALLIRSSAGLECVSTFPDCESALKVVKTQKPDVILMDIHLPGMSGIEGVRRIKQDVSQTEILMLTVSDNDEDVFDSLCAGASGYLKKNTESKRLIEAIRETMKGGAPMSMDIARRVIHSFHKTGSAEPLSAREHEVLKKLCAGNSYKMIAGDLFVDINTVKFHIRNIYRKLEVHSKGEAISKAFREGLN